jgi:hypothetical protein
MGSRLGLCSGVGMNDMAEGRWSSARGRAAEFCVTCVDLLYLRHVGHRQTISMPPSEFCQAATGTNFSARLQQWPTDEL